LAGTSENGVANAAGRTPTQSSNAKQTPMNARRTGRDMFASV
jgi:hypothetical protein